jgi:hypothetical protein
MSPGVASQVIVGSFDNKFGLLVNGTRAVQRFLNSSIPVTARVYFYAPSASGVPVGYVEALMELGPFISNEIGVIAFTSDTFTVLFTGQNWSLRYIWFYNVVQPSGSASLFPTHLAGSTTYTISAYTLGYVPQMSGGFQLPTGQLTAIASTPERAFITLFIANEIDLTIPVSNGQIFSSTPEEDHPIGQVISGGAETANLTAGVPTLQFNIFGFGAMELSNTTLCNTNVLFVGHLNICGQGHFYYIPPSGGCFEAADAATCTFDYGLDAGTYKAALPEFGFTVHFMNNLALPVVQFNDLFLQQGVFLQAIQMAMLTQQALVAGYCNPPPNYVAGHCLVPVPGLLNVQPLSWAQVTASNSTYQNSVATTDGVYDGVGALFLPAGAYSVVFSDVQYHASTSTPVTLAWGSSQTVSPSYLVPCPQGSSTC